MERRKSEKLFAFLTLTMILFLGVQSGVIETADASPAAAIVMSFEAVITSGGNFRALDLQTGDEVVQFTRDNVVLADAASGGFHTVGAAAGTASGGLTGSYSVEFNSIDLPVAVAPGYDGFGFNIGKGEIDCGSGNSFKFVFVADYDYLLVAPYVIHSVTTGYMVSVEESGTFSGQKLLGRFQSQTFDEDTDPGEETIRGTMTLTRYFADEISSMGEMTYEATALPGRMQPIPTLADDMLVSFTHASFVLPLDENTSFEEVNGGTTITITGGPLTGTITNERNVVTYFSYPTCMGWAAGKFTIADGADSISGVMVSDIEDIGTEQDGYLFALSVGTTTGKYAGNEYFGVTRSTVEPGTYDFTGSADIYELRASRTLYPVTVYVREATTGRAIEGAQISLDGIPRGTSNLMGMLTVTGIVPGTHTATATKTGYAALTVSFSVTRSTSVQIALTPTPTTGTLTIFVGDANTQAAVALAMVYIDGRYAGATNSLGQLTLMNVRSGTHIFTVIKSGYITRIQPVTLDTLPPWAITILLARR